MTDKQHRHFVELRGGDEKSVRQFYDAVAAAYDDGGPRRSHETGSDMFKFWSARYDEKWPATPVAAAPKDTGVVYQKMPSSRPVTEAR